MACLRTCLDLLTMMAYALGLPVRLHQAEHERADHACCACVCLPTFCVSHGLLPGVQHVVTATMEKGKTGVFALDERVVEGVLHMNIKRQDGYTYQIFELTETGAKMKKN